jgi:cephalosporin hydroxylase
MIDGYDQAFEDRLFDEISWPSDGYRLFDIGHFIGERDWLDGLWESNCLFVPRQLVEQVGAFDERFSMPGGGYANLDLYERLGMSPNVTVATILGEGSFHQVHGGTTTNMPDADARHRRLASYAQHFEEVRGRPFIGHRKPVHYVGSLIDESRRSRARRRVAPNFFKAGSAEGPDGRPEKPVPIPQELRAEFVDAYWRSLAWRQTKWLGATVAKLPMDLFAYQEIIHEVRPEWIIETGSGPGGRALFLASVCELLGHGRVISLDPKDRARPTHPRITYLTGPPWAAESAEQVIALVGDDPRAMVILGSQRNARRTRQEFDMYAPLVPIGSYVVVENTIYNGHPVWPAFGPGPAEAVKGIVEQRGEFVFDLKMDKYKFSFNPGGFLKRLA